MTRPPRGRKPGRQPSKGPGAGKRPEAPSAALAENEIPAWFDEGFYLEMNPDVAMAVRAGVMPSGYVHFMRHGWAEVRAFRTKRLPGGEGAPQPLVARGSGPAPVPPSADFPSAVDHVGLSAQGGVVVIAWAADGLSRLDSITVSCGEAQARLDSTCYARCHRPDVDAAIGRSGQPYGIFGLSHAARPFPSGQPCQVRLRLESGQETRHEVVPQIRSPMQLSEHVLAYLAQALLPGHRWAATAQALDAGLGDRLIAVNQALSRGFAKGVWHERFGPTPGGRLAGSVIVCLFGRAEFLPVQCALFGGRPGFADYELIYVVNSPDLAERVMAEARIAALVHALPITVAVLPGNAGFAGANNAAARLARSGRLLLVNPDVFPREPDWAARHSDLLASQPHSRTRLFGSTLYYDDGSLMHAGMFLEIDHVPDLSAAGIAPRKLLRVEHEGKGAPPDHVELCRSRAVTAVTGAFISIDRDWFEELEGLSDSYVFGHYEDADLCLRSLAAGTRPWLHDLGLYHLEGKGSVRLPEHEGASMVNRWHFSRTWLEALEAGRLALPWAREAGS